MIDEESQSKSQTSSQVERLDGQSSDEELTDVSVWFAEILLVYPNMLASSTVLTKKRMISFS